MSYKKVAENHNKLQEVVQNHFGALKHHEGLFNHYAPLVDKHELALYTLLDMPWWRRLFITRDKLASIMERKQHEMKLEREAREAVARAEHEKAMKEAQEKSKEEEEMKKVRDALDALPEGDENHEVLTGTGENPPQGIIEAKGEVTPFPRGGE